MDKEDSTYLFLDADSTGAKIKSVLYSFSANKLSYNSSYNITQRKYSQVCLQKCVKKYL